MTMVMDTSINTDSNIHSIYSGCGFCVFRQGNDLKALNDDYSVSTVRSGFCSGRPMSYLLVEGKVYYSDGVLSGVLESNGNVTVKSRSWGLEVPLPPGLCGMTGSLLSGLYQLALTYERRDGQESGASILSLIDLSMGGISIKYRFSKDPDVRTVNIYLSLVNDGPLCLLTKESNQHGGDDYGVFNYSSQSTLGNVLTTEGLKPPPPSSLIEHYNGRLYVAKHCTVWYSELFAYEVFDLSNSGFTFDAPITRLRAYPDGGISVETTSHVYFFKGKDAELFETPIVFKR